MSSYSFNREACYEYILICEWCEGSRETSYVLWRYGGDSQTDLTPWLWSESKLYKTIPSDRCLSAKLVLTFADRGCRVVSAMDPQDRFLDFLDPELLLFYSSSSTFILTRMSGPRSRHTTSQKIW
jgi:hypothetical protein